MDFPICVGVILGLETGRLVHLELASVLPELIESDRLAVTIDILQGTPTRVMAVNETQYSGFVRAFDVISRRGIGRAYFTYGLC